MRPTQLFLNADFCALTTTSQTLTDSSPVWNFWSYTTGTGTEASTQATIGQHISKIEIYMGIRAVQSQNGLAFCVD